MKRLISFLLVIVMIASVSAVQVFAAGESYSLSESTPTVAEAIAAYGGSVETYRYYVQIPTGDNGPIGTTGDFKGKKVPSWINSYSDANGDGVLDYGPGLYWWDALECPNPDAWAGYRVEKDETCDNVYYADVPVNVTSIIWNNGINGGMDTTADIFKAVGQTGNIGSEYYDPGENPLIPDGTENFNNMICILTPDRVSEATDVSPVRNFGADWYYYYGGGHYGTHNPGDEVIDEAFIEKYCVNPDHDHLLKGDADKDKRVSIFDVAAIQLVVAERWDSEKINFDNSDVDNDGEITSSDALLVQRFLAGLAEI